MNIMRRAALKMNERRKKISGVAVTYVSGSLRIDILATIGKTPFRFTDTKGFSRMEISRDFIIDAADLPHPPERGDRIAEADGYVYQVAAPNNEAMWQWHDSHKLSYRVHTKMIGEPGDADD